MLAPGTRLGPYVVGDPIAPGGMAVVYHARRVADDSPVALKVLFPHLALREKVRHRFAQGAWVQGQLEHPNIVGVDPEFVVTDHHVAFAMDLVEGWSLAQLHEERGCPAWAEAEVMAILFAISDGMAYAHDRQVVHRDLKPGNILIPRGEGGDAGLAELKIADFDLAKVLDAESAALLTRDGATLGTPPYMAPEQFRGSRDVTKAADVFAIGMIGWELLTGRRPVPSEDMAAAAELYSGRRPIPPIGAVADVSEGLSRVLDRCLRLDPQNRFRDAGALRRALTDARGIAEGANSAPSRAPALADPLPPKPRGIAPPLVFAAVVAAGGAFWMSQRAPEVRPPAEVAGPQREEGASAPPPPPGMVYVEGGPTIVGCDKSTAGCSNFPVRTVVVAPFFLDITEVSAASYSRCFAAGACPAPVHFFKSNRLCNVGAAERGDHPANCVTADQAGAFCSWTGRRLPTEEEWEAAARGGSGQAHPWGEDAATCSRAVINELGSQEGLGCGGGSSQLVGEGDPRYRTAEGVLRLSGNVSEWVSTMEGAKAVAKGGNFGLGPSQAAGWARLLQPADALTSAKVAILFGFRCAADLSTP